MRAKRVRALLAGLATENREARKEAKRDHYRAIEARAQGWDLRDPEPERRRKPAKVVLRGVGKPKREWEYGPTFAVRPLRQINEFFGELSDKGRELALRLKFGPPRTKGSAESLRAWPRGRPGQGTASRLSRPEIQRRIEALKVYIGVKAYI